RRLRIDPALPGYAALRDRLLPAVQSSGIDRPVDPLHQPRITTGGAPDAEVLAPLNGQPLQVGLELPADLAWPPRGMPGGTRDEAPDGTPGASPHSILNAGNLDSREQRNRLLDALAQSTTPRLLIACDTRQTPDRGTLGLIASLT